MRLHRFQYGYGCQLIKLKIESEIIFGFIAAPSRGIDDAALVSCVAWVAYFRDRAVDLSRMQDRVPVDGERT